jgi:hypothetical protein
VTVVQHNVICPRRIRGKGNGSDDHSWHQNHTHVTLPGPPSEVVLFVYDIQLYVIGSIRKLLDRDRYVKIMTDLRWPNGEVVSLDSLWTCGYQLHL